MPEFGVYSITVIFMTIQPFATPLTDMKLDAFLKKYGKEDANQLRLRLFKKEMSPSEHRELEFMLLQLEARKKFSGKFRGLLAEIPGFLFPSMLAGEQASHERVADYHAFSVLSMTEFPFSRFIDMTSGLGLDFLKISHTAMTCGKCECVALDIDPAKAEVISRNIQSLQSGKASESKIRAIAGDSIEFVRGLEEDDNGTLIFVDPARRGAGGNSRLFHPVDCQPDVVAHQSLLLEKADVVLIKNSPMLEPKELLKMFSNVRRLHIVSYMNECKEILVEMAKAADFLGLRIVDISCTDHDNKSAFDEGFSILDIPPSEWLDNSGIDYITASELERRINSGETTYLYEPSAGVMKSGAHGYIGRLFSNLKKASPNTNLYFSSVRHERFPGRILEVKRIVDKKNCRDLRGRRLNVVCRNHKMKPEKIAADFRLLSSPAADKFLYAFTVAHDVSGKDRGKPIMLIAEAME